MAAARSEPEPLGEEANRIIEEARMVLPGIQALFGFQLIAVFNERFESGLSPWEQGLHLAAIVLVVVSIGLIMTPAAYHRQAERGVVSPYFVHLASRLLALALTPLMLAITLEMFVVAKVVAQDNVVSIAIAGLLFMLLVWLWFIFPRLRTKTRAARRNQPRRARNDGAR